MRRWIAGVSLALAVLCLPAVLVAQDVPADVPGFLVLLLGIAAPSFAGFALTQVTKLSDAIAKLPDVLKLLLAAVWSFAATVVTQTTGIAFPVEASSFLSEVAVVGLINTGGAMAIFRLWKLVRPATP